MKTVQTALHELGLVSRTSANEIALWRGSLPEDDVEPLPLVNGGQATQIIRDCLENEKRCTVHLETFSGPHLEMAQLDVEDVSVDLPIKALPTGKVHVPWSNTESTDSLCGATLRRKEKTYTITDVEDVYVGGELFAHCTLEEQ